MPQAIAENSTAQHPQAPDDEELGDDLARLPEALDWPARRFCIGISRKRFLAWRAGTPDLPAARRDALTAQAHREALALGYRVFRTHAVQEDA